MKSSSHINNRMQQDQPQQQLNTNQVNINLIENGTNNAQHQIEQLQQHQQEAKLTPEQQQEIQLRIKYPNPQKPGGSAFIQKMLHKGSKKYFDSGDYNMAKSKNKALLNNINNINNNNQTNQQQNNINIVNNTPSLTTTAYTNSTATNTIDLQTSNDVSLSPASVNEFNSSNAIIIDSQTTTPNVTNISILNGVNESILTSNLNNSAVSQQSPSVHTLNATHINAQNTPTINSPMMSNSISSTSLLTNQNYLNSTNSLPVSISSSSIQMLTASMSQEKLSSIQINAQNLLDSEEIGVGIPTPECLPQSRKHSIVQSKLATPRLSSS